MIDSPDPRPFTPLLIGVWWPAPPAQPEAAIGYWLEHSLVKDHERFELRNLRMELRKSNNGCTAEDMMTRLAVGEQQLLDVAVHCLRKSEANKDVVEAITQLRTTLAGIAQSGNDRIEQILSEKKPIVEKLTEVQAVIREKNDAADTAGQAALDSITRSTQQLLDETASGEESRQWLKDHGANLDSPPRMPPITADELKNKASADGGGGASGYPNGTGPQPATGKAGGEAGAGGQSGTGASTPAPVHGAGVDGGQGGTSGAASSASDAGGGKGAAGLGASPPMTPTAASGTGADGGRGTPGGGVSSGTSGSAVGNAGSGSGSSANSGTSGAGGNSGGSGGNVSNAGSGGSVSNAGSGGGNIGASQGGDSGFTGGGGGGGTPGGGSGGGLGGTSPLTSAMPGLGGGNGGGVTPQGLQGGGLSQAFGSGTPGGPAGQGGLTPSSAPGGPGSTGFGQSATPQVPPSPSVTPMAGGALGNLAHLAGASSEVAPTTPTTGGPVAAPATPSAAATPVSVPSAPIASGPAVPSGPLPGYGADLRPPAGAAPVASGGPAAPLPPASSPLPGSPTTPASSGATVASAGDRATPGKPALGPAGQSGASTVGSMGAGGTAGAGAGTAAKRMAERDALQRTLNAVVRQAPSLAWAVGLRDDETTTMLVTDLASGWIPPIVKLPPGVTLLAPAQRRRDLSVVDLLGAVVASSTHQPNGYVTDAGANDPVPGSGERARYGQRVDELGPTLIDAAGAATRLPRIVQTVARAVARRSGVADNEIERFRNVVTDTAARVLSVYPQHAPMDVADWMLLAAIEALIDGSEELAHYHLAWYQSVTVRRTV